MAAQGPRPTSGYADQQAWDKEYFKRAALDTKVGKKKADEMRAAEEAKAKKKVSPADAASGVMRKPEGPQVPTLKSALTKAGTLAKHHRIDLPPAVKAQMVQAGQLDVNALKADPAALNALKSRAMGQGDSPWLKMQMEKQKLEELSAMDKAAGQSMSGAATARNMLAMKGGLSGGARERIAASAARDLNATRQGVGRSGAMDRLNLGVADDQTKMQLLSQIPGMDMAMAQQGIDMGKFNIGTKLGADTFSATAANDMAKYNTGMAYDAELKNKGAQLSALGLDNTGSLAVYGEQMKGYGAGKQADAIAAGGDGKKGVLGTGIGAK